MMSLSASASPVRPLPLLLLLLAACFPAAAEAGHELPFYPGYYPQEIRIETVAPAAAGPLLQKSALHAYVGADPFEGRKDPANVGSVESLGSYLVVTFNPAASSLGSAASRCEAAAKILGTLARSRGAYVFHPYPITPYHAHYLEHFDLIQARRKQFPGASTPPSLGALKLVGRGALAEKLVGHPKGSEARWDAAVEEVALDDLTAPQRASTIGWLGAPWAKEGWFHAYLLHAPNLRDSASRQAVDLLYRRLVTGAYGDPVEQANLERSLVSRLQEGCERVVAGYVVRRERFSAEFSEGIENIASDSQTGFDSHIFVRTAKLKDFPWNGWLRLGMATKPTAAWNPVAGFSDPVGRLVWAALGDPALLPAPGSASWVANRVTPASIMMSAPVPVPEDALMPEPGSGLLREVGKGKTARAKIVYRLWASAFHDNTRMGPADAVYPYIFASRWGVRRPQGGDEFDPAVEAATALGRRALAGFKVLRVDSEVRKYSDLTFTYVVPVIEVYVNSAASDPQQVAALAPPWSPVPWHVLALMEEAVKRGLGAFSAAEGGRRGIRWLDLARDPKVKEGLASLVEGFASEAYVPEGLKRLVTADEAQTRWSALKRFYQRRGHFLVTNGPYQLDKWSDRAVVLEVFRDFTNPMGVGGFDRFAIPRRAYIARLVPRGDRLEVYAEVERVEKFLRDYRLVREPFAPEGGDRADFPLCRYVVVGSDGAVVAAGTSGEAQGGRLTVKLKDKLKPGAYTVLAALYLGDNQVDPEIAATQYRVEATP